MSNRNTNQASSRLHVLFVVAFVVAGCEPLAEHDAYDEVDAPDVDGGAVAAQTSALVENPPFCWLESQGRGAGTVPDQCPPGHERNGALCYPVCNAGYYGDGPVCWQPCPAGSIDDGVTCRRDAVVQAKPSYGRGAGTVPGSCGGGQQYDAGLCYPACAPGYYGVGPVCWQSCPSGYADHGASCFQHIFSWFFKGSYGRGAGTTPNSCAGGQQMDAGLCYAYCAGGYSGVGPVCWGTCPSGFHDDGGTCRKDVVITPQPSYGRGAGVPLVCASTLEMDAGLCYGPCAGGRDGIGPVCWASCPEGMVTCGAGCAVSDAVCSNTLISQITSTLAVAANIAAAVLTMGGSTAVTGTTSVALSTATRASIKASFIAYLRTTPEFLAQQAGAAAAEEWLETTAEALAGAAEVGSVDLTILDPTGIAALAMAFEAPVCSAPAAATTGLTYGSTYRLENAWSNWGGGYLDTRGAGCDGGLLCVSSSTSTNRDSGSGSWVIVSATGKALGATVMSGDLVHLVNRYPYTSAGSEPTGGLATHGGFLDTRNAGCEGNHLCVSTSPSHDRAGAGTATWRIVADGTPAGTFRLQNAYANFSGGYLDTNSSGCEGNHLCVSTSTTPTREPNGTTSLWRAVP